MAAIYVGRDNTLERLLKANGVAQDLSSVTKIVIKASNGVTIEDSSPTEWPIKWQGLGETGKISMKLGDKFSSPGNVRLYLILYDAANPNGLVWGNIVVPVVTDV